MNTWLTQISTLEEKSSFLYDCSLCDWEGTETIEELTPIIKGNVAKFPCAIKKIGMNWEPCTLNIPLYIWNKFKNGKT